jgi:hypothetical protein
MISEYVDAVGVEFQLSGIMPVKVIPANLFSFNSLNSLSFALRKTCGFVERFEVPGMGMS